MISKVEEALLRICGRFNLLRSFQMPCIKMLNFTVETVDSGLRLI